MFLCGGDLVVPLRISINTAVTLLVFDCNWSRCSSTFVYKRSQVNKWSIRASLSVGGSGLSCALVASPDLTMTPDLTTTPCSQHRHMDRSRTVMRERDSWLGASRLNLGHATGFDGVQSLRP
ncbi:hypothetical protein EYF80_052767 [Liparis tanakae]|uniref:Uncharacterized protein n=1 Tax=Liparis tanakae TaxID=230148 RepID=A0A4Z2F8D3_9TELE|nr:hypothetical protein EYF80_052767 [Liparis tanakae]